MGYLAAFLGGLFALLSPCGALLLPAFFAYAFDRTARLLARTAVFYLGLAVTLVPLGMGAAQASRLVYGHQTLVATASGCLLIAFGLLQLATRGVTRTPARAAPMRPTRASGPAEDAAVPDGRGTASRSSSRDAACSRAASVWSTGAAVPAEDASVRDGRGAVPRSSSRPQPADRAPASGDRAEAPLLWAVDASGLRAADPAARGVGAWLRGRARGTSAVAVFVLGATSGLAGFCAGPVLGAVLTVAAASGEAVRGGALLAVYAAGMAAPLFVLAALGDRFGLARRLAGRGVRLGPVTVRAGAALSATVFAGLGVLFLVNRGTGGLVALFAPPGVNAWTRRAEAWAAAAQAHVPDLALLALLAAVIIAVALWRAFRARAGR